MVKLKGIMKNNWKYFLTAVLLLFIIVSFGYMKIILLSEPRHVLSGVVTSTGDKQFEEEGDYYAITAIYPSKTPFLKWYDARADAKVIEAVEQSIASTIETFKQTGNFEALSVEDKKTLGLIDGGKYILNIGYKSYTSPGYVSYVLGIYIDTGGAHSNSFFHTLTFDESGNSISLNRLFKDNSRYLERISAETESQVAAQLKEKIKADLTSSMKDKVRLGTSPTQEIFQFFYLDGKYLVILIPPYQAAAGAAGSFYASIPLDSFKDILK